MNRLQRWRGSATRFEQRAVHDWAAVVVAAIALWLVA
jgi:hypothetical protein